VGGSACGPGRCATARCWHGGRRRGSAGGGGCGARTPGWGDAAQMREGGLARSRWGLSPAVTSNCPAVSTPTPGRATRVGAAEVTSAWSWRSSRSSSAWSCCQRRARVRRLVLVAAIGLVRAPGRSPAHARTSALVLSPSSGWRSSSGALYSAHTAARRPPPEPSGRPGGPPAAPGSSPPDPRGSWARWRPASQGRPGSGLGVDRVRLAPASPQAAIGPVHLDSLQTIGAHEPGQPSSVGAGAFHPDALHPPKTLGPSHQGDIAAGRGRECLSGKQPPGDPGPRPRAGPGRCRPRR
jgi:hypothetical protein